MNNIGQRVIFATGNLRKKGAIQPVLNRAINGTHTMYKGTVVREKGPYWYIDVDDENYQLVTNNVNVSRMEDYYRAWNYIALEEAVQLVPLATIEQLIDQHPYSINPVFTTYVTQIDDGMLYLDRGLLDGHF